jgi:hypothetical protein
MYNRLHDYSSVVRTRSSTTRPCRQQLLQALPHLLDHLKPAILFERVSRYGLTRSRRTVRPPVFLSAPIVIVARPGLMPAPPRRPAQYRCHVTLENQDQLPEQPPYFGTTQAHTRLRWALKTAKLLCAGWFGSPFFGAASAPVSWRITLKKALAHIASVMWRYQPVNERTS